MSPQERATKIMTDALKGAAEVPKNKLTEDEFAIMKRDSMVLIELSAAFLSPGRALLAAAVMASYILETQIPKDRQEAVRKLVLNLIGEVRIPPQGR